MTESDREILPRGIKGAIWTILTLAGHGTKRTILEKLNEKPASWTDLIKATGVSEPVLANHLKEMQESEWIVKGKSTGLYEIRDLGNYTLVIVKEHEQITTRQQVVSYFVGPKGKAELSKLDKVSLKDDLLRIEDSLAGLMGFTELYHGLALRSRGKLFWSGLFEFGKLTRILVDFERFFYEVTSAVGFEKEFLRPLPDSEELVKKNTSKSIEEDELKAWNSATREQITSQLSDFVKAVRLACTRAKSDFKDHLSLTRAFDIMLRYIDTYWAVLDGLKVSYSVSEQPAYTAK